MASADDYKRLGEWLNTILKPYNYQVAPLAPAGKPGKNVKSMREFRLQLIQKNTDTSDKLIAAFPNLLSGKKDMMAPVISKVKFNSVSPNSSKFPSYSFDVNGQAIDLVIGRGANKGENFETKTVGDLAHAFSTRAGSSEFATLIKQLNDANPDFAHVEIKDVKQRKGSTKKEGVAIEALGAIIGDIVLTDTAGKPWYISLKDTNGNTFSSYSGAASIFDSQGTLQKNSAGSKFLESFGVDLNQVQLGFDVRNHKTTKRDHIPVSKESPSEIKAIFERAWGMNYFYVKKLPGSGWKVFWIDRAKLNKLAGGIKVTDIKYPGPKSKQISIYCSNGEYKYLIELRNSKAGEYPNDTKIKII